MGSEGVRAPGALLDLGVGFDLQQVVWTGQLLCLDRQALRRRRPKIALGQIGVFIEFGKRRAACHAKDNVADVRATGLQTGVNVLAYLLDLRAHVSLAHDFSGVFARDLPTDDQPMTTVAQYRGQLVTACGWAPKPVEVATLAAPAHLAGRRSVAVLPFENLSAEAGHGFFSDGVTEDVITALSRFPNLLVISKSASFRFKNSNASPAEIGRALGRAICPRAASAAPKIAFGSASN
jgi:hypothetical protein